MHSFEMGFQGWISDCFQAFDNAEYCIWVLTSTIINWPFTLTKCFLEWNIHVYRHKLCNRLWHTRTAPRHKLSFPAVSWNTGKRVTIMQPCSCGFLLFFFCFFFVFFPCLAGVEQFRLIVFLTKVCLSTIRIRIFACLHETGEHICIPGSCVPKVLCS